MSFLRENIHIFLSIGCECRVYNYKIKKKASRKNHLLKSEESGRPKTILQWLKKNNNKIRWHSESCRLLLEWPQTEWERGRKILPVESTDCSIFLSRHFSDEKYKNQISHIECFYMYRQMPLPKFLPPWDQLNQWTAVPYKNPFFKQRTHLTTLRKASKNTTTAEDNTVVWYGFSQRNCLNQHLEQ